MTTNGSTPTAPLRPQVTPEHRDLARSILFRRKTRNRVFAAHADLFRDPVWDMLLDLFVADAERDGLGVSSLSYSAGVSVSTALRWTSILEARGLVHSAIDKEDRRVRRVTLTQDAVHLMIRYLDDLARLERRDANG